MTIIGIDCYSKYDIKVYAVAPPPITTALIEDGCELIYRCILVNVEYS